MRTTAPQALQRSVTAKLKSARSTRPVSCLVSALLLTMLAGCSTMPSVLPMPALAANLAASCPSLPAPPQPLLDPERMVWENTMIALYGDCASRHFNTVKAWPQ